MFLFDDKSQVSKLYIRIGGNRYGITHPEEHLFQ